MAEHQDLRKEYEALLQHSSALQTELEAANQMAYDFKRQLKTAEALEREYQDEIKRLQSAVNKSNEKLQLRIQQLEENISNIQITCDEKINFLEKELSDKDYETAQLKKELETILKVSENKSSADDEKLLEEIVNLKGQNVELLQELSEIKDNCKTYAEQNVTLEETVLQMKNELLTLTETLQYKKDELEEACSRIETLQGDYLCLKSEFESVKTKPLDEKSQGNSLFAEVDDRRIQLQENVNIMKQKFVDMKREQANYLRQIASLRSENATLSARLKEEADERISDEEMVLESYKTQIQILNELIESYKKELDEKTQLANSSGEFKFFDNMLNSKKQEIESLRQKLSLRSLNQTLLSQDLAEARKEIRKWKLKVSQLENEMGQLKVKIEELQLKHITDEKKLIEEKKIKSIIKTNDIKFERREGTQEIQSSEESEISILDDSNKENSVETEASGVKTYRKVQFTADTAESNVTNRSTRRGKILDSKPIHIPSISKKTC